MFNKVKEYKHNNQTLLFDESLNSYILISYNTQVLEIVGNSIVMNGHGRYSVTTSKHITQALSYLKNKKVIA